MIISFVDIGVIVGHHFLFIMRICLYSITTEFYFAITSSIFHEGLISCTLPINYKKYCHIYLELINSIISRLNLYLRSHHDSRKWGDIHVLSLNIKNANILYLFIIVLTFPPALVECFTALVTIPNISNCK